MTVVSLLGLSVYPTTSNYENNTSFRLKSGEFVNSIDVLLNSFDNGEKFIFFGTAESIEKHKGAFGGSIEKKSVEFIEYTNGDLNDIFAKMISKIASIEEEILFDITHSFRDAVIMSVISTLIAQIVYKPKITMIYAKEIESRKRYAYELVGDYILNTSNIAFVLSSFIQTLRVPPLKSKYALYEELNQFSIHLLSNQFKAIYDEDIIQLKVFIEENRERLFFVKNLVEQLEEIVIAIEKTKEKPTYEKFLFFTEFFYKKDYYLHSATYLIEGLTQYIGVALKEQGFIVFDMDNYENQQKIVSLLRLNYKKEDFHFPHEYFVDINIALFNRLNSLRDSIAKIRHNLAHINTQQDYTKIKEDLKRLIEEYKTILTQKVLYTIDSTLDKKTDTVKYQLKRYEKEIITSYVLNPNASMPKFKTIYDKYQEGKLEDLTALDTQKVHRFFSKNIKTIEKLFNMQERRELLIEPENKNNKEIMPKSKFDIHKTSKKSRKKPKITQTEEEKKLLREGGEKLSELFNNR